MHELEISVTDLASRRDLRLLDIRPRAERWSGVGVIPGSVSPRVDLGAEIRAHLRNDVPVVLACMSGRRSLEDAVRHPGGTVLSLAGGLLGWQAAGLPSIGEGTDFNHIASCSAAPPQLGSLKRALVSCFVAEVAESDVVDDVDPVGLLDECFVLLDIDAQDPTVGELLQVVEWAAARSRELGNAYERIVENVSMFLQQMQPLARTAGG